MKIPEKPEKKGEGGKKGRKEGRFGIKRELLGFSTDGTLGEGEKHIRLIHSFVYSFIHSIARRGISTAPREREKSTSFIHSFIYLGPRTDGRLKEKKGGEARRL